jgi:polyhydroxyalkanoate synthase
MSYVVAGVTDHITPWQGCYNTAKLYGVLSNSGHIKSLLNPPGNPKRIRPARRERAPGWLERATKHAGSWWPHWLGGSRRARVR